MIYVGIDVAKDKHDCCILGSDGEILFSSFTIQNTLQGFDTLYEKIWSLTSDLTEIKVGLEATGHYHLNLLRSLLDNGLPSRYIQIFTEKVKALERRKRIKSMLLRLL